MCAPAFSDIFPDMQPKNHNPDKWGTSEYFNIPRLGTGGKTGHNYQIAATDAITQLPFFITTCDYTLMGEELYAASAYLSKEPLQLGSLKGQDYGKGFIMLMIIIGTILSSAGYLFLTDIFRTF